jgi:sugar-phosphatase
VSGVLTGDATDLGRLADQVFDAVIFDMDGTLIDSTPAVLRAWAVWTAEHGIAADDPRIPHGVPAAATVRALLPEALQEAAIERINAREIDDVDGIVLLPGAAEALAALNSAKNAIATSCTRALAQARIQAARLVPPSVVVTADDIAHGKPAPDPFLEAASRLGVDPRRCLVVEDAPAGLQAAAAAGCRRLAVITTTPRDQLVADAVVPNLASVVFESTTKGITVRPVSS